MLHRIWAAGAVFALGIGICGNPAWAGVARPVDLKNEVSDTLRQGSKRDLPPVKLVSSARHSAIQLAARGGGGGRGGGMARAGGGARVGGVGRVGGIGRVGGVARVGSGFRGPVAFRGIGNRAVGFRGVGAYRGWNGGVRRGWYGYGRGWYGARGWWGGYRPWYGYARPWLGYWPWWGGYYDASYGYPDYYDSYPSVSMYSSPYSYQVPYAVDPGSQGAVPEQLPYAEDAGPTDTSSGGIYTYDGGPTIPVPLPTAQPQRRTETPVKAVSNTRFVSQPAPRKKLTFKAYGETPSGTPEGGKALLVNRPN